MTDRPALDQGVPTDLILQVEDAARKTSYWEAVNKRLTEIRSHPDPNQVPCIVKVLMPNPTIPEEDMTMAHVRTEDGQLKMVLDARVFYPLTGPRMVVYGICVFHKGEPPRLEWLCEAPGQEW